MNIYVGNLPYRASEEDLRSAFAPFGEISSVAIIKDKVTGKAKGFGFVEMPNKAEAEHAVQELNGTELGGRNITVNEARPRPERAPRGGSYGSRY
ncbi:MAG: RNA-binding protein [Wenzhouxiangellaceae bacterium]